MADTPETNALPQVQMSPLRAAASPSKKTSEEPEEMALAPCPGIGQLVGSVIRAAGFAMHDSLSAVFNEGRLEQKAMMQAPRQMAFASGHQMHAQGPALLHQ
jgi:hypothetical protein